MGKNKKQLELNEEQNLNQASNEAKATNNAENEQSNDNNSSNETIAEKQQFKKATIFFARQRTERIIAFVMPVLMFVFGLLGVVLYKSNYKIASIVFLCLSGVAFILVVIFLIVCWYCQKIVNVTVNQTEKVNILHRIFSWTYTETIISVFATTGMSVYLMFTPTNKKEGIYWAVFIIILLVYIVLLVISLYNKDLKKKRDETKTKNKEKSELQKAKTINRNYIKLGDLLNNFLTSEIYYYDKYKLEKNDGLVEEQYNGNMRYWISFDRVECFRSHWDNICKELKALIDIIGKKSNESDENEKQFGANIIIMCHDGKSGFYMPSDAYTHMPNSRASIQNHIGYVDDDYVKDKYYKKLLDKNFFKVEILADKGEIKEAFNGEIKKAFNINDERDFEYNQYIAIPLRYNNVTYGILQIIAYNDSYLYFDEEAGINTQKETIRSKLRKYVNTYFSIYEKLILMTFVISLKEGGAHKNIDSSGTNKPTDDDNAAA